MKILMIGGTGTIRLQVEDPEFDAWCDRVIAAQEKAKQSI